VGTWTWNGMGTGWV